MKITKEAKVGLLAVSAIIILYAGFNFLKGSSIFSRTNIFYIVYDNIDGLTTSNPVTLNGLPVGRVTDIELLPEKQNHLLVSVELDKKIDVPAGTVAILADGGLLGGKVIKLQMGVSKSYLSGNDTLANAKEAGLSAILQQKAMPVLSQVDSLAHNLNLVAQGFKDTGKSLNSVLTTFDNTGNQLNGIVSDNRAQLAALIKNLNVLSASLAETEKGIKPLMAGASTFVDSLNALRLGQTVAGANQTLGELKQVIANLQSGKGSVGKLLNDDKLYTNLNYTIISLNQLLANFREQPKRYVNVSVFGRKSDKGPVVSPIDTTLKFKQPETQN